jgi:nitrite reductase/ring-hydroxylating ferredoxin subunit
LTVICRVDDIAERSGRSYVIARDGKDVPIMIVRVGETVHAFVNSCPHLGVNLDWQPDHFMDFERRYILCGMHGALFRIGDGLCIEGPCRGRKLEAVAIDVQDGAVTLA